MRARPVNLSEAQLDKARLVLAAREPVLEDQFQLGVLAGGFLREPQLVMPKETRATAGRARVGSSCRCRRH